MAKTKATRIAAEKVESAEAAKTERRVTLSDLQANSDLWYKLIHVLVYDLCNVANDRAAEARTLCTTDELYISAPYFTPDEAALIKATVISSPVLYDIPEFEALGVDDTNVESEESTKGKEIAKTITIEEAIKSCLQNSFEKRRASGDARPCGPHDMGPIYKAVFGITREEMKNERFLGRLRRAGLGQPKEKAVTEEGDSKKKKRKGGK